MRDKFRRLVGGRPAQHRGAGADETPPVEPSPAVPPDPLSSLADTRPGRAMARPGADRPALPPVNPPPSLPPAVPPVSKPVHTVAEKLAGRNDTQPVAPIIAPASEAGRPAARQQAEDYLQRLQRKVNQLADDFAEGVINRDQFQNLYEHYQRERRGVEGLLGQETSDDDLRAAIGEGRSVVIRRRHVARAQGYAIYENDSGMPITTLGNFELDPALVVPMLSSFRSAAKEIFGGGIRSTAIEGGHWLCFVSGEYTTLLALFSTEPAQKQMDYIEDLHRLFEKANRHKLRRPPVDPAGLLFPHEFFLKSKG